MSQFTVADTIMQWMEGAWRVLIVHTQCNLFLVACDFTGTVAISLSHCGSLSSVNPWNGGSSLQVV